VVTEPVDLSPTTSLSFCQAFSLGNAKEKAVGRELSNRYDIASRGRKMQGRQGGASCQKRIAITQKTIAITHKNCYRPPFS
jgi:hypothetical protein